MKVVSSDKTVTEANCSPKGGTINRAGSLKGADTNQRHAENNLASPVRKSLDVVEINPNTGNLND